jgi:FkbM family methyltransferase
MRQIEIPGDLSHLSDLERRRVLISASCRDCDGIPKVADAGKCFAADDAAYQVMHNGLKVTLGCYYGSWSIALMHRLRGHHEPQEERAFHAMLDHLPPRAVMVELGAFWGYYSLWFNARVAGARNLLVEADPHNLEVGRKNFALNGRRAEFVRAALGDESRPTVPVYCESDQVTRPCPQLCLDDLLRQQNIDHIDLLHADIQGAELAMLHGARASIRAGKVRFVFVSTHHVCISGDAFTHPKCLQFVREHGGHVLAQFTPEEGYSGDGLIVASFRASDRELSEIPLSKNQARHSLFGEGPYDHVAALQRVALARDQIDQLRIELARVAAERDQLSRDWRSVVGSRWWRWTGPPRAAVRWLRRKLSSRPRCQSGLTA